MDLRTSLPFQVEFRKQYKNSCLTVTTQEIAQMYETHGSPYRQ